MSDFDNFMEQKQAEYEELVKENQQRQSENAQKQLEQMNAEQSQMMEKFEEIKEELKETYEQSVNEQKDIERPGASTTTRQNQNNTPSVLHSIMPPIMIAVFIAAVIFAIVQYIHRSKKQKEYRKRLAYFQLLKRKGAEYQSKLKKLYKEKAEMDNDEWEREKEALNNTYYMQIEQICLAMQQQGIINEMQTQGFMQGVNDNMQQLASNDQFAAEQFANGQQFMNDCFQSDQAFNDMSSQFDYQCDMNNQAFDNQQFDNMNGF